MNKIDTFSTINIQIEGIVQGVGFRPFIYSLANRIKLTGSVSNTPTGVDIIATGRVCQLNQFIKKIETEAPPLAQINLVKTSPVPLNNSHKSFTIISSRRKEKATTLISPDTATCDDCITDIFTKDDRRYHYPFTNCTNCGPRLSIIKKLPYDREFTSMADFPMCSKCKQEYNNPADRRFHAQPNACPACGPTLEWMDNRGRVITKNNEDCFNNCALALSEGKIAAIKGLGGFHLSVDAFARQAVERLRKRKNRYDKPLAIMVNNLETARHLGCFNQQEFKLLTSHQRPIVLVKKRKSSLADNIAPNINEIGIMLPYTPVHHILFKQRDCPSALVMTSANLSGEPLCTDNQEAIEKLANITDFLLIHNRNIVTRVDDSVVRVIGGKKQTLRRSRGYAPAPIKVPGAKGMILSGGAELKNCLCIARNEDFFLSQHIGDLKGPANMDFFSETSDYLQKTLEITPELFAHDLHPDYLSSRYCSDLAEKQGKKNVKVQHHHAHAAAIMAEHNIEEGLAIIFDGTGLGADNTIWGGEFLLIKKDRSYERLAHLGQFSLPGGDKASEEIWRIGLSLSQHVRNRHNLQFMEDIATEKRNAIMQLIDKGINSPLSSSVGRLFDGVAAIIGIRQTVTFEAQAAMELETLSWQAWEEKREVADKYKTVRITDNRNDQFQIDYRPLINHLIDDLQKNVPITVLALAFHIWLAETTLHMVSKLNNQGRFNNKKIMLGGGCFQNRLLFKFIQERLYGSGFEVYSGEEIPVNDGCIALGQAFIASKEKREKNR